MGSFKSRVATTLPAALVAALAAVVGTPSSALAGGGTVRDDDGGRNAAIHVDYSDDTAVKRLVLPAGIMSGASAATLTVYAQANSCGAFGATHRLEVNGYIGQDFNPCEMFGVAGYGWATLPFNLHQLVDGATNTFRIYEIAGDWNDRNASYGVDTDRDFGRSDIRQSSVEFTGDIPGELMWYLTVYTSVQPPQAGITVTPTYHDFGTVPPGTSTASRTVTVTSSGTADLTISGVTMGGTNPGDFAKSADTCAGARMAPGVSCTFQVAFTPSAQGARSAVVTIANNAGDRTVTVVGHGAAPGLSVSPSTIDFGTVAVGSSSPRTVVVRSDGTAPVTVYAVTGTGPSPGDFPITSDTCTGRTMAPGATCTFQVAFAPTGSGYRNASATVTSDSYFGTRNVLLWGQGDAFAPTSTFKAANGSPVVSGAPVTGRSVDDASAVVQVRVTFAPFTSLLVPSTVVATLSACTATSCEWSATAPLLPGVYLVNARATDSFGRLETPGPTITVVVV